MSKERPILFSGPMVRALLDGSKTQTRRAMKPQPTHFNPAGVPRRVIPTGGPSYVIRCPYGQPGDRLWVRETWQGPLLQEFEADADPDWHYASHIHQYQNPAHCEYAADGGPKPEYTNADDVMRQGWRPSIHMPRWASRILLEVTQVRVEQLQAISIGQICKEGLARSIYEFIPVTAAFDAFADVWDSINGPGAWEANPWVWAVEFKQVQS